MKNLFAIVSVAFTTLLVSCTTIDQVALSSNWESDYRETIEEIVVIIGHCENVKLDNLNKQLSLDNYMKESFERVFRSVGIDTRVILVPDAISDNNVLETMRSTIGSKSIMFIERSRSNFGLYKGISNSPTAPVTYTLDITLSDTILKKRIWQSKIIVLGEFSNFTVDELMHDLVLAMNSDGLFRIKNNQFPTYDKRYALTTAGLWGSVLLLGGAVGMIYIFSQLLLID